MAFRRKVFQGEDRQFRRIFLQPRHLFFQNGGEGWTGQRGQTQGEGWEMVIQEREGKSCVWDAGDC